MTAKAANKQQNVEKPTESSSATSSTATYIRLFVYVTGIYASFLTWAVVQERITSIEYTVEGQEPEKFKFFIFLNTCQAATAALVAFICTRFLQSDIPALTKELGFDYFKIAMTNSLASPFGYRALQHINYPTFVLAKSCKLVPVMLTGTLLYKRKFQWFKYTSVFLITMGVASFTLFKSSSKMSDDKESSWYGIFLVFINLFLDGFTNSSQDQLFKKYNMTSWAMMFYMNLASSTLMTVYLLSPATPELFNALTFVQNHPDALHDMALFCLCGAVGQAFIFLTMQHFGSLALVSVTVTRKLFTIFVSCLWYSHPISNGQIASVGVVFCGIALEAFMKEREKWIDRLEKKEK